MVETTKPWVTMAEDDASVVTGRQPRRCARAPGLSFLIADDHPPVTMAVSLMLRQVAGTESPAPACFTRSDKLLAACALPAPAPRIVVLDLVMPGELKRAALVRALHKAAPDARILAYTADESAFLAQAVMDGGAMGYVAKTSPADELMDALRAILANKRYVDRNVDLDGVKDHPWRSLTDSERSILLAFSRGAKASDLAAASGRSYSTVTTHKYNGLKKLDLRDSGGLVPYLHANGLIWELDEDILQKP